MSNCSGKIQARVGTVITMVDSLGLGDVPRAHLSVAPDGEVKYIVSMSRMTEREVKTIEASVSTYVHADSKFICELQGGRDLAALKIYPKGSRLTATQKDQKLCVEIEAWLVRSVNYADPHEI